MRSQSFAPVTLRLDTLSPSLENFPPSHPKVAASNPVNFVCHAATFVLRRYTTLEHLFTYVDYGVAVSC